MRDRAEVRKLITRAAKIGIQIWRGYDIGFQHNWVVEIARGEHIYLEYTQQALNELVIAIERDQKLKQLGL